MQKSKDLVALNSFAKTSFAKNTWNGQHGLSMAETDYEIRNLRSFCLVSLRDLLLRLEKPLLEVMYFSGCRSHYLGTCLSCCNWVH